MRSPLLLHRVERILAEPAGQIPTDDPKRAARALREALLAVRDSADVISFVQAYRPDALVPLQHLDRLFAGLLPDRQARWAAQTLVHFVLGFVAEEQNRAELLRGGIPAGEPGDDDPLDAFDFGIDAIIAGAAAMGPAPESPG